MNVAVFVVFLILLVHSSISFAINSANTDSLDPKSIAVQEIISDKKIQKRLSDILNAVGSYEDVKVKVISGVVILSGLVDKEEQMDWAHQLATRLDGVVAVQNRVKNRPSEILDLTPAREEIVGFNVTLIRHLPTIILAISVFIISLLLFFLAAYGFRRALKKKITSPLLLSATAKFLSIPVFFLGLYLALRISGLAGLAYTVLGGTGLLGLVLGLGLKNSFEDYAASIFLSIKKPFRPSDWVKIGDYEGIVQKVTSRSTLIIDFSGNHILMPNNLVYKSIITNMTANPKMRYDFVIGLDYDDSIEDAQSLILDLLDQSHLVLSDPEPWALIDELGASSVNLRIYFWLNVREVSIFKVSSHLRLEIKNLLLSKGFRFPDPEREIIFTNELPSAGDTKSLKKLVTQSVTNKPPAIEEVKAEVSELNKQSRESDLPDQGENVI